VAALREAERSLAQRSADQVEADRQRIGAAIEAIARAMRSRAAQP